MPRKQRRPELSPVAEQLRARAVSKRGVSATLRLALLVNLPPVAELAQSDDRYRRALAFEGLLVEAIDRLDETFFVVRDRYESPTWIARGLFQIDEERWDPDITKRRATIIDRYGGNADHFRQTYEKDLYEHLAVQLEGWQVDGTQTTHGEPSEWPWDQWVQSLVGPAVALYEELDRGLYVPPLEGGGRVRVDDLVELWVKFLVAYETRADFDAGVMTSESPDFAISEHARSIRDLIPPEFGPPTHPPLLSSIDQEILLTEFKKRRARGVPFSTFLHRFRVGRELYQEWIQLLATCTCSCKGDQSPKRFALSCPLHRLQRKCEKFLTEIRPEYVLPRERREEDPAWASVPNNQVWPLYGLMRFAVDSG